MEGPPHKKPRSSSPPLSTCENDISWVSEFNSELPDELSKLVTCTTSTTACSSANNATATTQVNNGASSSRTKAEETIQKNKNLSQLLSTNEPRPQLQLQQQHQQQLHQGGVMPMGMVNRGPFRQSGMGLPPTGSSPMQMMAGRQRGAGFIGQGGMHGMVSYIQNQQQLPPGVGGGGGGMYSHMHGGPMMMNSSYPNAATAIRHPDFARHKSIPGTNMAASMSGGHFVDGHRAMTNGGVFARSSSLEGQYNNGLFGDGPILHNQPMMMSGGSVNPAAPSSSNLNQGANNGFGAISQVNNNAQQQISGNPAAIGGNPVIVNGGGSSVPPQQMVDGKQLNPSPATSGGSTPSLGLLSPDPTISATPRSTTAANFPQANKTGMLSPETGMFPVSPAVPPDGADQTANAPSKEEQKREAQNDLWLLLHAHNCQKFEQQHLNGCPVPTCSAMKATLKHMTLCQDKNACKVPQCSKLRNLIQHWKGCKKSECAVCLPVVMKLKKDQQELHRNQLLLKTQKQVLQQSQQNTSAPPTPTPQVATSDGTSQQQPSTLQQPPASTYNSLVSTPTTQPSPSSVPPPGKAAPVYSSSFPCTSTSSSSSSGASASSQNSLDSQYNSLTSSLSNNSNDISSPLSVPQQQQQQQQQLQQQNPSASSLLGQEILVGGDSEARANREWRSEVQQNLRTHLVQKLPCIPTSVHAIFPTNDLSILSAEKMNDLIIYARKLEADMYENAASKEHYYQLLAEKIYKISKELEEKRAKRAQDGGQQHGQMQGPPHGHMGQPDPQGYDGPVNFGNPQLNSIYMMNHTVGMGQQSQQRMGGGPPLPHHPQQQQPGHSSQQFMDHFGGDVMMHHHPRAHPHHPRMHPQFMNNPRMGIDPYGQRMPQHQQGPGMVPYRCNDPSMGQVMYRGTGNMPGGGMMEGPFVNHRAMSSNVRPPTFMNEAFANKHDMQMELQRQQMQIDHHHHQGMSAMPGGGPLPANSAQHLGASSSMMMMSGHPPSSSSSSNSASTNANHQAPPISFTPSPADPGGSNQGMQPSQLHLGDGPQLSPFARGMVVRTPSVPPSPNPGGFVNPGSLSMPSCTTANSLLSPPSFSNNSPASINRQQQQQTIMFNSGGNNTSTNGPLTNKNSPFDVTSASTPSGAGHPHLSSGSGLTPVHTPIPKVLGTPNPLIKHEDATDDYEVPAVKSEPRSLEDFKYDAKAAGHEDITDDEAENSAGVPQQARTKMNLDPTSCNSLIVKQECLSNSIGMGSSSNNSSSSTCMMIKSEFKEEKQQATEGGEYGSAATMECKPVIKIEPKSDHAETSDVRAEEGGVCCPENRSRSEKMETDDSKNVSAATNEDCTSSDGSCSAVVAVSTAGSSEETGSGGGGNSQVVAVPPSGNVVEGKKIFTQSELFQALEPVLNKLYDQVTECGPFQEPVDPINLGIPDYHEIIKKPMDMGTIKKKLETGLYANPWEFIDDVGLMFDNAWLYNRKTSKVYKYCSKLAEVFDNEIDDAMQSLGYCCGRRHVFSPQVLCCFGKQLCSIPRDMVYYNYLDRYIYCEKCFNELQGEEVEMVDDPSQPGLRIKKVQFVKEKNDKLDHELFVNCKICDRKMHKICAIYMEQIWPEGYICKNCNRSGTVSRKENKYTARRLPTTKLGTYLETRVNSLLKKKNSEAGEVTIRVLSSYDKVVEVKPGMKARYVAKGEMPEGYPYRVKAMFAFQEIDGSDVCFFGMHVQEYGSDCPPPNCRRVYIAYLDSVHFFQPRHLRTTVYHEILIGYLEYVKSQGFEMAHIWACPPSEGDDYIFHCHPPDQKIPKPKRLQDWYKKMLDKASQDRVIVDYKDIHRDASENHFDVTDMPYFEGDFWPNILEECIKDIEHEENEKRKRQEEEAAQDTDDLESECTNGTELETFAGKKKGQKSGSTKKKNSKSKKPSNRKSKSGAHGDLLLKLTLTMEKHKEGFFVIRLQPRSDCPAVIRDPDPLMNCDLMDGRDAFLTLARDKHYEFSSLRRAKYSTMGLLYELHNQARDGFIYSCNDCKANVETRHHCPVCDDYDLCINCFAKSDHPHKAQMKKLGLGFDEIANTANNAGAARPNQEETGFANAAENKTMCMKSYIQALTHACHCLDANCHMKACRTMKEMVRHLKLCKNRMTGACRKCKQLLVLLVAHSKQCKENKCPVPFCASLKQKFEQQKAESKFKNNQLMRRRMAIMQRQPMPDRGEQTPQPNQMMNSDPPTPSQQHHPGKYLHHLGGSPPPNQASLHHHQAAMMASHQAEQMAQSQRQVPPGYGGGGGQMMMNPSNSLMMMGGGGVTGGAGGNPMMGGGGMNQMMPGAGGSMVGGSAAMMSGGGPMTMQQQRMMIMQQQQQQHGGGPNHMMDRQGGGMSFVQEDIYRQQQIMAMQQQQAGGSMGGMDPMCLSGPPGQTASNHMAMILAKKKEAANMMKSGAQIMTNLPKQSRQRQMMAAGGQMMDPGMIDDSGMMNSMGPGGTQMMGGQMMPDHQQMMSGHGQGSRMMSPSQQQQQQWMMHHHQQMRPEYAGRPQQFGGMQPGHHPSMMYPGVQSSQRVRGMGGFGGNMNPSGGGPMHPSSMISDGMDTMMSQNYLQQQQQIMMQRRVQMKQAGMMAPPGGNGGGALQQRLQMAPGNIQGGGGAGNMAYMGSPGMMMEMGAPGNVQHQQSQQQGQQPQQMPNNAIASQLQSTSSMSSSILPPASSAPILPGIPQQQQSRMLSHVPQGKRVGSPPRRLPNYNDTVMMQQHQQQISSRGGSAMKNPADSYMNPTDPNGSRLRFTAAPDYMDPPMYAPQTPAPSNPNDPLSRFVNNM